MYPRSPHQCIVDFSRRADMKLSCSIVHCQHCTQTRFWSRKLFLENYSTSHNLTCVNLMKRELLLLFGVSQLPNDSKIMLALAAFVDRSLALQRNCVKWLVDIVFPEPDSPVITMHCDLLVFFIDINASFPMIQMGTQQIDLLLFIWIHTKMFMKWDSTYRLKIYVVTNIGVLPYDMNVFGQLNINLTQNGKDSLLIKLSP